MQIYNTKMNQSRKYGKAEAKSCMHLYGWTRSRVAEAAEKTQWRKSQSCPLQMWGISSQVAYDDF